jgi:hypothetical protein
MTAESSARHEGWFRGKFYRDIAQDPCGCGGSWGVRGAWAQNSNNIVCAGTLNTPNTLCSLCGGAPLPSKVGASTSSADINASLAINGWNQGEIYSFHSGIAVVGMGDGSVRSLKDTIDLSILIRMAAAGDGYPVNPDQ